MARTKSKLTRRIAALDDKPNTIRQEYRIVDKAGTLRWVMDHKTSFFDNSGALAGIDDGVG